MGRASAAALHASDAARFARPAASLPPRIAAPAAPSDEVKAERAELLVLKALAADARFTLALWRLVRKYRPDQPRDELGRWVDEGGGNRPRAALAGMPRIPRQRPPNSRDRTTIAKEVARSIAETGLAAAAFISRTSWLYHAIPYISSYMDAPKPLANCSRMLCRRRRDTISIISLSSRRRSRMDIRGPGLTGPTIS